MATIRISDMRSWLFDAALPFWSTTGIDPASGAAVEQLDAQAVPMDPGWTRTRVQARQIYVFSQAAQMGWTQGLPIAARIVQFLLMHGMRAEGGFVHKMRLSGEVIDTTFDLYDNAFALFAMASFYRVSGEAPVMKIVHRTLDAIEDRLSRGNGPGYRSTDLPDDDVLRQNPHMHLLEALLALHEVSPDIRFYDQALRIIHMVRERVLLPQTRLLPEACGQDWRPLAGIDGRIIEPGHLYEWVWLLRWAERLQVASSAEDVQRMMAWANAHGVAPSGLVYDQVLDDGAVHLATHRLWPQGEALKAHLVQAEAGCGDPARAAALLTALLDRYLTPAGVWRERLQPDLTPQPGIIPTSSFYHLMMAFSEVFRVAPQLEVPAASTRAPEYVGN